MMHTYITLADDTVINYTDIKTINNEPAIEIYIERPTDEGFVSARCAIPSYTWSMNDGFTQGDLDFFTTLLHHNAHTIFEFADRRKTVA